MSKDNPDTDQVPLVKDIRAVPGCEHPTFGSEYWKWEEEVATPALTAAGYTDIRFYNAEADSFGPLVRGCGCKDASGNTVTFCYG